MSLAYLLNDDCLFTIKISHFEYHLSILQ